MINIEIISPAGNRHYFKSALHIRENTAQGIHTGWIAVGKGLKTEFKRQVLDKASKTGRIYILRDASGRRRRHQASAPGQTPANRSGRYRKEVGTIRRPTELEFGDSAPWAGYLERGTKFMAPRPGLGNTVRAQDRDIIRDLSESIVNRL